MVEIIWGILAALVAAMWSITIFIRDKINRDHEINNDILRKLSEIQQINFQNPGIQNYFYISRNVTKDFFREDNRFTDGNKDRFIKTKNLAYLELNLFDEIISFTKPSVFTITILKGISFNEKWKKISDFLVKRSLIEKENWEAYIKCKLRHPLYESILDEEGYPSANGQKISIFGESLKKFWDENKKEITAKPIDPFLW